MNHSDIEIWLCALDWDLIIKAFEAIILAAGFIWGICSFKKSKQNELKLQKDHFRKSLNLKIYEEVSRLIYETSSKLTKFYGTAMSLPFQIKFFWDQKTMGLNPKVIDIDSNALSTISSDASDGLIGVILELERYLIAFPQIKTSKEMLGIQSNKQSESFIKFFQEIVSYLPMQLMQVNDSNQTLLSNEEYSSSNGYIICMRRIPPDKLDGIRQLSNELSGDVLESSSYLQDILISLQKLLLGDLFDASKLNYRIPQDSKYKVLKIDEATMRELESIVKAHTEETLRRLH